MHLTSRGRRREPPSDSGTQAPNSSFPRNRLCQNPASVRNGADAPNRHSRPPSVIPAKQAVSKPHPSEAQTPEIVIPAKAGIQVGWGGEYAAVAPLRRPWIPAFAGMTEGGGNDGLAFRTWKMAFDTAWQAGMTSNSISPARRTGLRSGSAPA